MTTLEDQTNTSCQGHASGILRKALSSGTCTLCAQSLCLRPLPVSHITGPRATDQFYPTLSFFDLLLSQSSLVPEDICETGRRRTVHNCHRRREGDPKATVIGASSDHSAHRSSRETIALHSIHKDYTIYLLGESERKQKESTSHENETNKVHATHSTRS